MKSFVALLVIFSFTYAIHAEIVNWVDIYKGDTEIPKDEKTAKENSWKVTDSDEVLKIKWYVHDSDPTISLGFDQRGVLAGTSLTIPVGKKDDFYKNSIIFEEKTKSGKTHYSTSVILTDLDVLKIHGGRRTTADDEIAQKVIVKHKDGTYEEIKRDACDNAKPGLFVEQGCKEGYGLVFSPLKKEENSCSYPFFLVYNEEQNVGELLGFGWLLPGITSKGSSDLTTNDKKTLFPVAPDCADELSPVVIWLAKKESKKAKCAEPIGQFVEKRCQTKRSLRGGEDNF